MGYKYNKEDILNVGYDVLRRNGYHSVGINQILKEAGIPKGSFYNFFVSKEDFVQQVITQYGQSNGAWIEAFFEKSTSSPIAALRSFYSLLIQMNEEDSFAGGCLVNNMSIEVGSNNAVVAAEANTQFVSWLQILAKVIAKGQTAGEITTDYSALQLAEYLHAGFYGALSRSKVTQSRAYMDTWLAMTLKFIK